MDNARFDQWTRLVAQKGSRRRVLAAFVVGAVAPLLASRSARAQVGEPGGMCGGIAGIPCPLGYECVDAIDGCDPNAGGADCSGVCVAQDINPCAAMLCLEGTECCPQCGGLCVPAGTQCSEDLCPGQPCNQAVCGPGEYCCNESCSRCVPLGQGCTREFCTSPPTGKQCGAIQCGVGEFCCNESCGICAPIGGACTDQFCGPGAIEGERCGPIVCPIGQVCCNESCGICTPLDGACIALYCELTPYSLE